jgi:tetratricopeptide (TPR) repeat protein
MKQLLSFALVLALCTGVEASWYWPFSSDDETKPPRVSELMEPASVMIDEAYDLADEGKTSEAVEKYRAALAELDRIEAENPDRVKEPEFNTLKNKRATVRAAIDSLLLSEAQDNARTIAVSDTTELQKKYDAKYRKATKMEERGSAKPEPESDATPEATEVADEPEAPAEQPKVIELPQKPKSKMAIALEDLAKRDFAAVELTVKEILEEKPNDAAALNLKAAAEMAQGDAKAAEKTLDQAIHSNPRGYHAYYNMARLMAGLKGNRSGAKHYYEAGRSLGGPVDAKLEELLK